MATQTIENIVDRETEAGYVIKFPIQTMDNLAAYDLLVQKMEEREAQSFEVFAKDLELELRDPKEGLPAVIKFKTTDGKFEDVQVSANGLKSLLRMMQISDSKSLIKISDQKAIQVFMESFNKRREMVSGRPLRIQSTVKDGLRRVIHVSSARTEELDDLKVLRSIQRIAKDWGLQPAKALVSDHGLRMSLVALGKDLPMKNLGEIGHRIYGEGDRLYPGMDVLISATKLPNRVEQFWFNRICENGAIFGMKQAGARTMRKGVPDLAELFASEFELLIRHMGDTANLIGALQNQAFNDRTVIKILCEAEDVTGPYKEKLEAELIELEANKADRYSAWNAITRIAHAEDVSITQQINLEKVGGKYVYLNN